MYDILIFAAIAAFLIYRLNSVLGTRNGGERDRQNPFAPQEAPKKGAADGSNVHTINQAPVQNVIPLAGFDKLVDQSANADGSIETGLADIAAVDPYFDINGFMQGARGAFEMVVMSYSRGELDTLKTLLSDKLYRDFEAGVKAREAAGHTVELTFHRIKEARIIEAHLGGTMAYVTVDFDVEETTVTRDSAGEVIGGNPDRVFSVEDIWTFTRDTRAADPNWLLIETRAVEN